MIPSGRPVACSVDPVTGNLAVSNTYPGGNVAIYKRAQGRAHRYADPHRIYNSIAFDSQGNLFVDGWGFGGKHPWILGELARGKEEFSNISLKIPYTKYAGSMVWDGQYLAIQSATSNQWKAPVVLYQVAIAGSTATIVNTISFAKWQAIGQRYFCLRTARLSPFRAASCAGESMYGAIQEAAQSIERSLCPGTPTA